MNILDRILFLTPGHAIKIDNKWIAPDRMGSIATMKDFEEIGIDDRRNIILYHLELENGVDRRENSFYANGIEVESYSRENLI